jgi:hypothetical protein
MTDEHRDEKPASRDSHQGSVSRTQQDDIDCRIGDEVGRCGALMVGSKHGSSSAARKRAAWLAHKPLCAFPLHEAAMRSDLI